MDGLPALDTLAQGNLGRSNPTILAQRNLSMFNPTRQFMIPKQNIKHTLSIIRPSDHLPIMNKLAGTHRETILPFLASVFEEL